jgi:acetoin utilization deacetylase AcuC-like enzyme
MRPAIVHHPAYTAALPAGHRFPMAKFGRLLEHLLRTGLAKRQRLFQPIPASRAWLELAHDRDYVTDIIGQTLDPARERQLGLPLSPALVQRSRVATAGTLLAARLALADGLACNTAGGSHHAFRSGGAGFCVFNDVAVAAMVLLTEGSVMRVLVVDLDVHQGDGTAAIFRDDPRVFTLSIHCRANYPARKQQGDLDIALDPDVCDADYLATLASTLPALLDRVRPDLVFYNAGVDPHRDDRLGRLALTDAGLADRESLVLESCRRRGLPLACTVGGGYAPTIEALVARHAILHQVAHDLPPW